jgi:hypothetical protein
VCFSEDLLHNILGILGVTENMPCCAKNHRPMFANKGFPIDHAGPHVAVGRLYQYVKAEREMSVEGILDSLQSHG